jgi:hypothetical protein
MVKYGDGGNPVPEDQRPKPPEILPEPGQEPKPPPEVLLEPGQEAPEQPPAPTPPPEVLLESGQEPPAPVPAVERTNTWGCTPKATAGIAVIVAVIVAIWFGLGNKDDGGEESAGTTTTTAESTTTTTTSEAGSPVAGFAPPDPASLPAGTVLLTGASGDQIGFIAQDGQSRFLHLERPGVGVGNQEMGPQSIVWPTTAKVTGFGVDLDTSTNPGRYGINLFIPPSTYSVGCSIEKGELGCVATPDNIDRTPPIAKDEAVTIIIGEEGNLDAEGDFTLSWWLTYKPA